MTALHVAAKWGHLKLVKKLLSLGADINAQDNEGHDALHFALRFARVLTGVKNGASPGGNNIAECVCRWLLSLLLFCLEHIATW